MTLTKEKFQEYMVVVSDLQNEPKNQSQDHMTICGFFDTCEEFKQHIENLKIRAGR